MSTLHEQLLAELDRLDPHRLTTLGKVTAAVLALHTPFQRSTLSLGCRACSTPVHTLPGRYVTVVNSPCSTIQAIARELGVSGG